MNRRAQRPYEGLNGGWSEMLSMSSRLPRPRRASIIGAVSTASAASGTSVSRTKLSDSAVNDGTTRVSFSYSTQCVYEFNPGC